MSAVTICDCTLRDGSHAKSHAIDVGEARAVAAALDGVGVPVIEVSHGDGLGGSSFNYGFSSTDELVLIEAALGQLDRAALAVLVLPGIGTKVELARAATLGARVARVATHCTEADIAEQHLTLTRDLGMRAVGFLMMVHMIEPEELACQAQVMADSGAEVVYVVDSAGALVTGQVRARVEALAAALPPGVAIGFHGHHNLGMGVANTVEAVLAGATWLDASTCGMGAGAGNAPTELLVAVLTKLGVETGIEPLALLDVAEDVVRPILARPPLADRAAILLGYAGVYSSFLLHAERAASRFGVDAKAILVELGRRRAVGGQEDLIADVAAELARSASAPVGSATATA